jgi:hypothetical protein
MPPNKRMKLTKAAMANPNRGLRSLCAVFDRPTLRTSDLKSAIETALAGASPVSRLASSRERADS